MARAKWHCKPETSGVAQREACERKVNPAADTASRRHRGIGSISFESSHK
jgi:hypothetical protein